MALVNHYFLLPEAAQMNGNYHAMMEHARLLYELHGWRVEPYDPVVLEWM